MAIQLSKYQQDALYWHEAHKGLGDNLILDAVAGSGKTTLATEIFRAATGMRGRMAYIAFNKDIKLAVAPKIAGLGVEAYTYHSLGRAALVNTLGGVQLDENKLVSYVQSDPKMKYLAYKVKKLAEISKGNGIESPDDSFLEMAALEYDVDFEDSGGRENLAQKRMVFDWVRKAISYSIENPTVVDYADMIFLPYILPEVQMPQFDLMIVDEYQDTDHVQMEVSFRSKTSSGNLIGIGDRMQAIYAFRGAGSDSMDKGKQFMQADELPLSLCYRCPQDVAKWVNKQFPAIKFEVPKSNIKGNVADVKEKWAIENMKHGDLVLCRVNSELVTMAFELLRAGRKAQIKGRDIGRGLEAIIKKSNAGTTKEFLDWLSAWEDRQLDKATRAGSEAKRQNVIDKCDSLKVIAEGTNDVEEIRVRCNSLFSDDVRGITLSTVHRAKGLEVDTVDNDVFILRPDLMPHPAAQTMVARQQEENIRYVAATRTKNGLYFVQPDAQS